ncbi:MAG TPA: metal ABC transporter permease [Sphingobacteriaceae bacterium]|nr:metal ABC transporter permease [Sphingobacteriaceae bacterium]
MDAWSELVQALQLGFMQRAYIAGAVTGLLCPLIGTFLVTRRMALMADGLGHASFAGLVAGTLMGGRPLAGALAVSLLGALGIERLRRGHRTAGDVAIAIYSSFGLGVGMVLARMAGGLPMDLTGVLFGSIITVQPGDLAWILALAAVVVVTLTALRHQLFSILVHEEAARAVGIKVDLISQVLLLLTAATIVVAMRVVGILLVSALMVLPVATSLQFARGLGRTMGYSVVLGILSVVVGITAAYLADLPAGAAIVLTNLVFFAVAAAWSSARGY